MITPLASVITCFFDFLIQFTMFIIIDVVFIITGANVGMTIYALLSPVLILQMGLLGMSIGLIISSLTVKYRDLQVLVNFGVQLLMYLAPIVYSASSIKNETLHTFIMLNPMSPIIELMKKGFIGTGSIPWLFWAISGAITLLIAFFAIIIFNKTERNFIDNI